MSISGPTARRVPNKDPDGSGRSEYRRDHDRVFYSAEFERLEDVTQIATVTSSSVRNRLTHSYRVEQIARSIADANRNSPEIDEDIVMTAALVHDIGHAPFGHTGEEALQKAVSCERHRAEPLTLEQRRSDVPKLLSGEKSQFLCENGICILPDGFEGNAQSFRILTLLGSNHPSSISAGLNLTRRTLRASLKYSWLRGEKESKPGKWGIYDLDAESYAWVLNVFDENFPDSISGHLPQAIEASIMDISDDVAYAVHDIEDAYKAGLIPFSEILLSPPSPTFLKILAYIRAELQGPLHTSSVQSILDEWDDVKGDFRKILDKDGSGTPKYPHLNQLEQLMNILAAPRYTEGLDSRKRLSTWRGALIKLFVGDVVVNDAVADFGNEHLRSGIEFLKQLTWYFVIDDPDLSAIREGQEALMTACFERLFREACAANLSDIAADSASWLETPLHRVAKRLPERLTDYVALARLQQENAKVALVTPRQAVARATLDYICSLTDSEVYSYSLQLDGAPSHAVPRAFTR
ncbi:hypothetical protein C5C86_03180 [Rathayibacter sp. AY1E4]|uniref:deoxyguanosinetriphosphate triphosphohydrolase family protein n=1 Tax=Rathayibacter sp. AY1E4 TaxID=2080552 RepID=UPI000CE881C7|nr:dNTP triphosphohydrolase [Rathayibacter sp. AY1E4]PPH42896.1 hypothetical protein C5C86_03180 [Rathayibacter sp. AY1E4]